MNTPSYDEIVRRINLDELVKQVHDLPTLPAIVMDILNSLDNEDIDITVLAKKVSHDQALTAKTLRFANSSFYASQSKVTTIPQAITLLGVQSVRNLITAAAMSGCFPEKICAGFDFKVFWRHSMATAVCARVIARHMRLNQDIAFVAGLLHDIGRLVLVTRFTETYEAVIAYREAQDCYLLDAEHAVMGVDHTMAGHALAVHWHFSNAIQNAIAEHHAPDPDAGSALAQLVHVANVVVHALDLARDDDDLVPPMSESAWNALGLGKTAWLQIFRETELEFGEMDKVL
jgi:putative nucleotidyltransferase with HDIG domain